MSKGRPSIMGTLFSSQNRVCLL